MTVFSIVIPTFGRAASLDRLLRALAELDYPAAGFEVIIIDDGGHDPLDRVVAGYAARLSLCLLRQPNLGPAAARNHGARQASGSYLAFTDDDCLPESGWLRAFDKELQAAPHAMCGGRTTRLEGGTVSSEATQLLADYLFDNYSPVSRNGAFFPTNNMAVPRNEFLELGGFDERLRFGEDREFCFRWQARGWPFRAVREAIIRHSHPQDLAGFLRLHFSYGSGTGRFRRTCAQKGLPSPAYSTPFWYVRLVGYGMKRIPGLRGVGLSLLLAASQAASLAGILWTMAATRREDA